jgi:hypothetical protein
MAANCRICGSTAIVSWQPFGPSPDGPRSGFSMPGWHYRGFPVVPVCDLCKTLIEHDQPVRFTWKGQRYHLEGDKLSKED